MNWKTFKNELIKHSNLVLQFQYTDDSWVGASYHITEIKQAQIVSVDCGGKMNSWTEVIVQLWEPSEKKSGKAMQVTKALKIIDLVENSLSINPQSIVKIEFGNTTFDTRQMHPNEITISGENLVINLQPDITQCKAQDTCGKPKNQLDELVKSGEVCCTPGGSCC